MELFNKILKIAVDGGASDIHIKIGTPVVFRINRELVAVECPHPTADWMNNVVALVTPPGSSLKQGPRAVAGLRIEN